MVRTVRLTDVVPTINPSLIIFGIFRGGPADLR